MWTGYDSSLVQWSDGFTLSVREDSLVSDRIELISVRELGPGLIRTQEGMWFRISSPSVIVVINVDPFFK